MLDDRERRVEACIAKLCVGDLTVLSLGCWIRLLRECGDEGFDAALRKLHV